MGGAEINVFEDGGVRVPVREVDSTANSRRARVRKLEPPSTPKPTGLNAVESALEKRLHPKLDENSDGSDAEQGGAACAR